MLVIGFPMMMNRGVDGERNFLKNPPSEVPFPIFIRMTDGADNVLVRCYASNILRCARQEEIVAFIESRPTGSATMIGMMQPY